MIPKSETPTRERLLDATVALLRTKGAAGTGTAEILQRAGAPRGSFYFHFPEGKDQLVLEAVQRAAAGTLAVLDDALAGDAHPAEQVRAVFTAIGADLVANDYGPGCAVGVTALESAAGSPAFQGAVSAAFATWTATLAAALVARGVPEERAGALADAVVAGMEGATMLARAHRSTAPLDHTAEALALAITATVPNC